MSHEQNNHTVTSQPLPYGDVSQMQHSYPPPQQYPMAPMGGPPGPQPTGVLNAKFSYDFLVIKKIV